MPTTTLNVDLVESIQRAVERSRPIDILGQLTSTTLSGLLEFVCLRYAYGNLPVPQKVRATPLGSELQKVSPGLTFLSELSNPIVNNLDVRPAEFRLLPSMEELGNVHWESFLSRFEKSAKSVGFTKKAAAKLQSALFEMCENAVIHSKAHVIPLTGYVVTDATVQFSVVDVGIGVRNSLNQRRLYSSLADDVDAIYLALQTGVTSRQNELGGFGFQSVFKALAEQWGELRFRSGAGCISLDGRGVAVDRCHRHRPPPLPGFQISVTCRADGCGPSSTSF